MGESQLKRLITPEQLSTVLDVNLQTIWTWVRTKKLPKVPNMGRVIRFDPDVVEKHFKIKLLKD